MSPRSIALATALAIALSIISILLFDRPVAELVHQLGGEHSKVLTTGTTVLELFFGITLSKFALGFVLIIVGLALFAWKAKRYIAWMLLFIGCTHFTARLVTGVLKEVFHRLRPYEVLPSGSWDNQFFTAHDRQPLEEVLALLVKHGGKLSRHFSDVRPGGGGDR
jgi:hypothetical protein